MFYLKYGLQRFILVSEKLESVCLQSREFSGFRYFVELVSNCMNQEPNYYTVYNVSIAHDE